MGQTAPWTIFIPSSNPEFSGRGMTARGTKSNIARLDRAKAPTPDSSNAGSSARGKIGLSAGEREWLLCQMATQPPLSAETSKATREGPPALSPASRKHSDPPSASSEAKTNSLARLNAAQYRIVIACTSHSRESPTDKPKAKSDLGERGATC